MIIFRFYTSFIIKPEFENLIRSNDFVCFVETKTDMFDSIDLPGYVFKSKHRKNVARMRSGGILLGFVFSMFRFEYITW
jgi:hypothetical protein